MSQHAAPRNARSRRPAHAAWQEQQRISRPLLLCSAAGEQNGAGPQLTEEEVKRMTDDFVKEIIEGAGADDPESKTYQIRVRHMNSCSFSQYTTVGGACPLGYDETQLW